MEIIDIIMQSPENMLTKTTKKTKTIQKNNMSKDTMTSLINTENYYYEWINNKDNLPKLKLSKNEFEDKNLIIDYMYKCMIIDNSKSDNLVYFIRNSNTGLLKIGKTKNLKQRLKSLYGEFTLLGLNKDNLKIEAISYCPFNMDNSPVEAHYHNVFKNKRKIGEWFDVSHEELLNSLSINYTIDDVLITIEDICNFSNNIIHLDMSYENYKKYIKNSVKHYITYRNSYGYQEINNVYKDLYTYINNVKYEDKMLDRIIKCRIENILHSL